MRILISDPKHANALATIFCNLKQFSSVITMHVSEDGVYIQGMDTSQVCLFECKVASEWFDTFEMGDDDKLSLSLATSITAKVMAARAATQIVTMEAEAGCDKLSLSFTGCSDVYDKYFELPLMDSETDLMNVPDKESDVDLALPSKSFGELVNQFEMFADTLTLKFTEEKITMRASGAEGSMETNIHLDDVSEYAIGEGSQLEQSFSLRYIKMMASFGKLANETQMEFSAESPLIIRYSLTDGAEDDSSYVRFYLAPKISDE